MEKRIAELEKKNAVLEYRVQEQQEEIKNIKSFVNSSFTKIENLMTQIVNDPFGLNKLN